MTMIKSRSYKLKNLNIVSSFAIIFALLSSTNSTAQTTPEAKPQETAKPAEKTNTASETVTVTGTKPVNRIDRQAYDVTNDTAAQTGTASDALNRVPAVSVDAEGNVSLRGNQNVQVLINGRSTAMLKGENRAATLMSMAGSDITSVEVLNNPGAAFSAEGAGGVINIVTKANRRPGKFLNIMSNFGNDDRFNANILGTITTDKYAFNASLNYRKDGRYFINDSIAIRQNITTGVITSKNNGFIDGRMERIGGNIGLELYPTTNDTLAFSYGYATREQKPRESFNEYLGYNVSNFLIRNYTQDDTGVNKNTSENAGINLEHRFEQIGETLKLNLTYSKSEDDNRINRAINNLLPVIDDYIEYRLRDAVSTNWVASLDYNKPVGEGLIGTGYQITIDDNDYKNNIDTQNLTTNIITSDVNQTNSFEYYQIVNAGYFTYQAPLGEKWTGQAGLRFENTDVNTFNPKTNIAGSSKYTNFAPSAFLSYNLSQEAKLRFAYSRRIQRPNPQDLDPSVIYQNASFISIGNPDLKPQKTDSLEVGYEYSTKEYNWQLRGFYRYNTDIITSSFRYLTDTIVETSRINGNNSQTIGSELNLDRKFGTKLRARGNINVNYTEQDAIDVSVGKLDAISINGRIMADYNMTPKDQFTFMVMGQGKQLTAQGYRIPGVNNNLTYRHNFTPFASFMVNITDPLGLGRNKIVTDSNNIFQITNQKIESRVIYVGFRITLGTMPKNVNPDQLRGPGGGGGGGSRGIF